MLTGREFERRYDALLAERAGGRDNQRCIECVECHGCTGSTFCRASEALIYCHYCVDCAHSVDSSHCRGCRGLSNCHHCTDTENSIGCSYVARSTGLRDCTYCFGCVGLERADYHILNERYDRAEYFRVIRRLTEELKPR